ncbi:dihydroxyacetone kinase phosphoryl donor subunit DhaM [Tersicoccus sp. Bi-70]|uniref:dihydroxyacetone kinase phosphoryl donor subunit DhaM n=1 Tax=Tersicoccus sp. Bi-70 TaxID=1897634 RepID=UPI000975CA46|nr:dihydroxyacetone kinase phosphoryl donor subunit DhaM [Tersicoccus sp. Bi-70]OMH32399.1 PTS-dependent dihydroxyacetone kinase phosphotransferase subunit DhaM [Tersicoccus sp. Bi-70]
MSVGLVIVSHSPKIAEGVRDLAAQMAADVRIVPAGGTDEGGIGTSLEVVMAAVESAQSGDGVVVLTDLGSAVMTAESVLEFLDDDARALVRVPDAPLVEGAVAAAVAAQGGADLDRVAADAAAAGGVGTSGDPGDGPDRPATASASDATASVSGPTGAAAQPTAEGTFTLTNKVGLHARPAAMLAQALGGLDADTRVNGVDGASVMMLMTLAAGQGATLTVESTGPEAERAIETVADLVGRGFDED